MSGKSRYLCQGCGFASPKWLGRCPDCGSWNSLIEEATGGTRTAKSRAAGVADPLPSPLDSISAADAPRIPTGSSELDRVLGGGLVPGSVVLLGGDPGIGKTTLLLEYLGRLAAVRSELVLYCSGEESPRQIKMRADRIGLSTDRLVVFSQNSLEPVLAEIRRLRPVAVVVDSIQTITTEVLESTAGSISQVREVASQLIAVAKRQEVPIFLVGHVTKDGTLAGPRVLEHMVDTVLYFEGENTRDFRILRAVKNRFGSTNEIGVFEMSDGGLREVANPSRLFLREDRTELAGSVITAAVEGTRPFLVEVQALCAHSSFVSPKRGCSGTDAGRLAMLIAILEKKLGLMLADQDVYLNLAGGIRVVEPATDLAIALAVFSSFRNAVVDAGMVVFGELGLTGEVRGVSNPEARVKEAAKLGFRTCLIPGANLPRVAGMGREITICGVATLAEVIDRMIL
ncbi:MAG: DNA repair protein RadA [Candidatus Methylomirabilia bacterium]